MAKIYQGILGGFEGKLGPVTGYRLGNKWVVRRLPQQVCNPKTERQVAHRMLFRDMVRLASALLPALKTGYRALAREWDVTEGNAFVKTNWNPAAMPDFKDLRISVGYVPLVDFTSIVREEGRLELRWEKNLMVCGAKSDDVIHFYAYSEAEKACREVGTAVRRERQATLLLPEGYDHVWAVMEDRMGRTSQSRYLEQTESHEVTEIPNIPESPEHSENLNCQTIPVTPVCTEQEPPQAVPRE